MGVWSLWVRTDAGQRLFGARRGVCRGCAGCGLCKREMSLGMCSGHIFTNACQCLAVLTGVYQYLPVCPNAFLKQLDFWKKVSSAFTRFDQ